MSVSGSEDDEDSKLGKHEHWEATYTAELANLDETGDEGEIWFGEDVLATMIEWTDALLLERLTDAHDASILDLGTGNGSFLFELAGLGYKKLHGSDYSAQSICLAKAIARKRGVSNISWIQDNLLASTVTDKFDVLTDKGTLDAVGLMADAKQQRPIYRQAAYDLLKDNGILIITSCNSTAQELEEEFCSGERPVFKFIERVRTYPTFKFGGVEGTRVCTLAFCKV